MALHHLVSTHQLSVGDITQILDDAAAVLTPQGIAPTVFRECTGKRIVLAFFEPSTRTRLSFESAAERLGASSIFFQTQGSSVEKGETLRETIETIQAMGFDALIIRHGRNGVMSEIASYATMSVINAGEGSHQHPSQALLDASAMRERFGTVEGVRVAIVGDLAHSRVARSTADVLQRLGALIAWCAPNELSPTDTELAALPRFESIDECLNWANAVYLLRIQHERMDNSVELGTMRYRERYALTTERAVAFPAVAIMHPGPVNVGVEIDEAVLSMPSTLIHRQVTHGVAVRMAILRSILHS